MMPSSSRNEKNLPASNKLKHGMWALQLNAQPAAVNKIHPNSGQQSRRKSLTSHVFGLPAPVKMFSVLAMTFS
jgi:hypothetical protein